MQNKQDLLKDVKNLEQKIIDLEKFIDSKNLSNLSNLSNNEKDIFLSQSRHMKNYFECLLKIVKILRDQEKSQLKIEMLANYLREITEFGYSFNYSGCVELAKKIISYFDDLDD